MKYWKSLFLSIPLSSTPFILWDIYFTKQAFWGFNPLYISKIYIFNLPVEEVLFFVCIPFACIFTHIAILKIKPLKLAQNSSRALNIIIIVGCILLTVFNIQKAYTVWVMLAVILTQTIANKYFKDLTRHYYITFLFMIIPFLIVNGVLTGSLIEEEIVWYNNNQTLGLRVGTIPFEDLFYAYALILINLMSFKLISKNKLVDYQ